MLKLDKTLKTAQEVIHKDPVWSHMKKNMNKKLATANIKSRTTCLVKASTNNAPLL
jgi:hypothetical protein